MSSVRRRARTPLGSPTYYASSAFSVSSSPFDASPRSRSALHQSSLDLNKGRNPSLSRRFRDSSWGSSECLFRPSSTALASTANYVLSNMGADFQRCRSPARGFTPPPPLRRFGRDSSPSPVSSYYKSTYASSWYDEYRPILRERPALATCDRPARGSKERRESMGIITRHRHVVKFREDPTLHESSPVVSRTRQDGSGHSTRSVDSGIGSFKECQSVQSPVDLEDILGLDAPPVVLEELRRDLLPATTAIKEVEAKLSDDLAATVQKDHADDRVGRRRRMRNRTASEELLSSATSSVSQQSESSTISKQRTRSSRPDKAEINGLAQKQDVTDGETTPTIELPKVSEMYETVVVKLKKPKGKNLSGDISPVPDTVGSVAHCLPTPNGHCVEASDESVQARTREISPAVVTVELPPKKTDNSAQETVHDSKAMTTSAANTLQGLKKVPKTGKVASSLAQLKTGKKPEQDQSKAKKDAKALSPSPKSSQPSTPEARDKPKLVNKVTPTMPKLGTQEQSKSKTEDVKPPTTSNVTGSQLAASKLQSSAVPQPKQQVPEDAPTPQRSDKKPPFQTQQQQKLEPNSTPVDKHRDVDIIKPAPKEAVTSKGPQPKVVDTKQESTEKSSPVADMTAKKTALGMLEFRKKEPQGRLAFKSKEPQGMLELKKKQPIPMGPPPEAMVTSKSRDTVPPSKPTQEPQLAPTPPPKKETPAVAQQDKIPPAGPRPAIPTSLPLKKRSAALPDLSSPILDKPQPLATAPRAGSAEAKVDNRLNKIRRSKDSESSGHSVLSSSSGLTALSPLASPQVETVTTPPSTPDTGEPPGKTPRKVKKVKKVKKASKIKIASLASGSSSSGSSSSAKRSAKKASQELESPTASEPATSGASAPAILSATVAIEAVVEPTELVGEPLRTADVAPKQKQPDEDAGADASCGKFGGPVLLALPFWCPGSLTQGRGKSENIARRVVYALCLCTSSPSSAH
ncbi:hypothetical protein HPB51_006192 [Rhipicephalus microplus]|uniref:Uncharacterized protein n=1 Tax=Rhipicephalus microplus TaxID=6941 RepID=A0A9J6E6U8_RHIMP|nr:hypothetical protein HPB51_006192 [Rhipicephalus microplus]